MQILQQIWPNVNHYVRDLLRDAIQPKLKERLEKYKLNGFKFERIILGSVVSELFARENFSLYSFAIFYSHLALGVLKCTIKTFHALKSSWTLIYCT